MDRSNCFVRRRGVDLNEPLDHNLAVVIFVFVCLGDRNKLSCHVWFTTVVARGRVGVCPPSRPTDAKVALARKLFYDATVNIDDICSTLKMPRTTLYRHVQMSGGMVQRS